MVDNVVESYYIYEDDFSSEMIGTLRELCERYNSHMVGKEVLTGRNRNVFVLRGGIVVKIPTCLDGFQDNDWEGSISNLPINDPEYDPDDIQYARTRLFEYKGVPVLFMEYVEYADSREIKRRIRYEPDWVMSVDGGQVGFNSKGRLVAFDYGCR